VHQKKFEGCTSSSASNPSAKYDIHFVVVDGEDIVRPLSTSS
jgi:hypothetical protein